MNTGNLRKSWPPTATNRSLEELNLFTVDFNGVGTGELCGTQDYVDAVLFAEVFS